MLKEITLSYDLWYAADKYYGSGFYKVTDPNNEYGTEVVIVLKEANLVCLIGNFTEDIEKSISNMFQNYFKKELNSIESSKVKVEDTKSIISFDDVLKAIAVTQDPRVIKDLVK